MGPESVVADRGAQSVAITFPAKRRRRILCVVPSYNPSFGTFENAYPLCGRRVRAFMPPQGMLVIAAYLPSHWEVRFVDENIAPAKDRDFAWADAVLVSGMHIQRDKINRINARAHALGKTTVLGGPSVSAAPENYPGFDYLHLGELGDATDLLIKALEENPSRPEQQIVLQTRERLALDRFPVPAYRLVELDRYFLASIQFSSGCPFQCEFCDIPSLYGRVPRLKKPEQILAELDAICAQPGLNAIYFVDDNFIGNRKAARELLPHLIDWQKRNGYPVQFACEATLNIANENETLRMMREAYFCTLFCGIETPELDALRAMKKDQNARLPILEAVEKINSFGIEVVSGIILGLDTDTSETPQRILEFITRSNIPILTINLLEALPRTPLWQRLEAEGRLVKDPGRESNVAFKLPYEEVVAGWRNLIAAAYEPATLYRRFAHAVDCTYVNRLPLPVTSARLNLPNIRRALRIARHLLVKVGIRSDYRDTFWKLCGPLLKAGRIEQVIHVGLVAHHLISFAREAAAGHQNASFYSARSRAPIEAGNAAPAAVS
ncbi:MAG: B12-binding domain-containing radical SAM protein [Alphaproteobacteria bacterium]|nr:B12-binding domain-containing radical SAM protein [Alphaproteobacteria bacterium]